MVRVKISQIALDKFKYSFFVCSMNETTPIDFTLAIERHRVALLRIVVTLFGMLGLAEGAAVGRISRLRNNAILRVLRLAEAAVRRLIVAAARDVVAKPRPSRPFPKGTKIPRGTGTSNKTPAFQLSDKHEPWLPPRSKRKPKKPGPRISFLEDDGLIHDWKYPHLTAEQLAALRAAQAVQPQPSPKPQPRPKRENDGKVDGSRLQRRLQAIMGALKDIPKQAQRLANWKARREAQADQGKRVHTSPLREFFRSRSKEPPSHRDLSIPRDPLRHEAENLYYECNWLAREAMRIDSS
jgi:hypothetical protein